MNMQELKQLIYKGEKVDIECREAKNNVPRSAYESYSAFANTKGGYSILDVKEDNMQTMLRMVGFGDNAGSGFLSILAAWTAATKNRRYIRIE